MNNHNTIDNVLISEIIEKIEKLPFNAETTIAQLVNYNPEKDFVDPLTQGEIFSALTENCKERAINIELIRDKERFTGLAFYYKFKKVNSNKNID